MKKLYIIIGCILSLSSLNAGLASIGEGISDIAHGTADVAVGAAEGATDVAVGATEDAADIATGAVDVATSPLTYHSRRPVESVEFADEDNHLENRQFAESANDDNYGGDYPNA